MADYIDALHAHHLAPETDAVVRNRAVHDLMRSQEIAVISPLLDYLAGRNDLRLLGPRRAQDRAPTVAVALDRAAEPVSEALARHGQHLLGLRQGTAQRPHLVAVSLDLLACRPIVMAGIQVIPRHLIHSSLKHLLDEGVNAIL
jgi:selenocysteine lyase/cysteine desulfurase